MVLDILEIPVQQILQESLGGPESLVSLVSPEGLGNLGTLPLSDQYVLGILGNLEDHLILGTLIHPDRYVLGIPGNLKDLDLQ